MPLSHPSPRVPWLKSLPFSIFLQTALLIAVTVFLLAGTAFLLARSELTRQTFQQLELLAGGREDLIETTINRQRRQIAVVAQNENLPSLEDVPALVGLASLSVLYEDGTMESIRGINPDITPRVAMQAIGGETTIVPFLGKSGNVSYLIVSPRRNASGALVASFDASELLSLLLDGSDADGRLHLAIGLNVNDDILLARRSPDGIVRTTYLGNASEVAGEATALMASLRGFEGTDEGRDETGIPVFSAYRFIPSLGWSVIASADRHIALSSVRTLALSMFGGGLAAILLSLIVVWMVARRITAPLLRITRKLTQVEKHHWEYAHDVKTGNELGIVDAAAADLAARLRETYTHLEDLVRDRTKQILDAHALDRAIFASMEHGLIVTDQTARIVLINPAAERLTGYTAEQATGKMADEILVLHDKKGNLAATEHPLHTVCRTKQGAAATDPGYVLHAQDGAEYAVQVITSPIMRGRNCTGGVALFRDTTEERKLEERKSQFISIASHQLRTPISSIRWYVEMLMGSDDGPLAKNQQLAVEQIDVANRRMVRLVDALLKLTSLELKTQKVARHASVNLRSVMTDVDGSYALEVKRKSLTQMYEGPDAVSVQTDETLFRLIYENLIENAMKYSHDGGHIVVKLTEDDGRVTLRVSDEGIGIPKHEHKRVFEKLFRASNVLAMDTDGTGLGLSISKYAADAIGAELTFESEEKKGTTFTLVFPLSQDASARGTDAAVRKEA